MEALTTVTEKLGISSKDTDTSTQSESSAPSKNALKKAAKEAEKAKKKAEAAAKRAAEKAEGTTEAPDFSEGKYGVVPLIQSTTRTRRSPRLLPLTG